MSDIHDDYIDHSDRPTEELYIELRDLEHMESRPVDTSDQHDPTPGAPLDDASAIRERIAHLRALLSDRGAIRD